MAYDLLARFFSGVIVGLAMIGMAHVVYYLLHDQDR